MATKLLTGDKELDRKLNELANKSARKVAAAGIRAGMRVIAKAIKSEIPPSMKDVKKSIGFRFRRNTRKGDGLILAKVGAGVGQKRPDRKGKRKSRGPCIGRKIAVRGSRPGRPGVGLGRAPHWPLLGTVARFQCTTLRKTGIMPSLPAVKLGFAKSEAAFIQKVKDNIGKGIEREFKK